MTKGFAVTLLHHNLRFLRRETLNRLSYNFQLNNEHQKHTSICIISRSLQLNASICSSCFPQQFFHFFINASHKPLGEKATEKGNSFYRNFVINEPPQGNWQDVPLSFAPFSSSFLTLTLRILSKDDNGNCGKDI